MIPLLKIRPAGLVPSPSVMVKPVAVMVAPESTLSA